MSVHPTPTATHVGDNVRVFCQDRVAVVVPESDAGFAETGRYAATRAAEIGAPLAMLALIRPGVRGDPLRVRKGTHDLLTEHADCLSAVAMAIDGRGFFASAFMSMASGVFLHVRHAPVPMQVFNQPEDAATWLAKSIDVPPETVLAFVATVRAQLEAA
ncbi:MAG: hypothetical protein ACE37F_25675 [Nannocystaceae bacterium]|nr:hypothetical protein [bacterium]